MEGTEVNQIVIAAYSSATSALRTMRKESGVTVESVENAMELFQEEVDLFILLFLLMIKVRNYVTSMQRWTKCSKSMMR